MNNSTTKPHWDWMMPASFSAGQFNSLNRFLTVNSESGFAVEGSFGGDEADAVCKELNAHEVRYSRPEIYVVRPIPAKLHDRDPATWRSLLSEGEESRQKRMDAFSKLMKVNYPPAFVALASKSLAAAGSYQGVDWAALHDEILQRSIGRDVRDPPRALAELLHYSPAVVTRDEQDALCARLEELIVRSRPINDISSQPEASHRRRRSM